MAKTENLTKKAQTKAKELKEKLTDKETVDEFKVKGEDLLDKVKELAQEGNIRRIIIKNEKGNKLLEIPLFLGLLGALLAPYLAAIGVIAAVVTSCSIIVERRK